MRFWAQAIALSLLLSVSGASAQTADERPPVSEAADRPLVDLNTATEAELLALPGVGPAKARAILAYREAHGGFTSVSQLMRVKGFGRATLKRLRPLLTVSPRVPPRGAASGNGR
jgi:competence protein ComEA